MNYQALSNTIIRSMMMSSAMTDEFVLKYKANGKTDVSPNNGANHLENACSVLFEEDQQGSANHAHLANVTWTFERPLKDIKYLYYIYTCSVCAQHEMNMSCAQYYLNKNNFRS